MTKDEIIDLADKCFIESKNQIDFIQIFAYLIAQQEREACAKIADNFAMTSQYKTQRSLAEWCASSIRARGQA